MTHGSRKMYHQGIDENCCVGCDILGLKFKGSDQFSWFHLLIKFYPEDDDMESKTCVKTVKALTLNKTIVNVSEHQEFFISEIITVFIIINLVSLTLSIWDY